MTIHEILKLPTEKLEELSDRQLDELLGPMIPAARNPDRESAQMRDMQQLLKQARAMLEAS